jgi:hypothetical protein
VRYLKVRDVDKLEQALNNVWFGDLRVWAKVAKFARKEEEVRERVNVEGVRGSKVGEGEREKIIERKNGGELGREGENVASKMVMVRVA